MLGQNGIREEINKLIRIYFDAKEHYRLAAKRATGDQQAKLTALVEDREAFHIQMQELITRMNVEMSDNGTVWEDFKRDWERLRGAVAGDGLATALKMAQESDKSAIDQADRLIHAGVPEPLDNLLKRQLDQIKKDQQQLAGWIDATTQPQPA